MLVVHSSVLNMRVDIVRIGHELHLCECMRSCGQALLFEESWSEGSLCVCGVCRFICYQYDQNNDTVDQYYS
jgi:hypothetical protein